MLQLKPGDKMSVIKEDRHETLICVGVHPKKDVGMVFVKSSDWISAVTISYHHFERSYEKYYTGDYDSVVVGKVMTEHLQNRINSIKETYVAKANPFKSA